MMHYTVDDLARFGLKLKTELNNNPSLSTATLIAEKINHSFHDDGSSLSDIEKEHIINYIKYPFYDHKTGNYRLLEGDNSEYLKLVALVAQLVNK